MTTNGESKFSYLLVGLGLGAIGGFMQRFRNLGLIETNSDHFLVIKENKLTDYLAQIA